MIKEVVVSAKSVEEAVENGCVRLGVDRDRLGHEVLEESAKGLFSIFKNSQYKVRVFYELTKSDVAMAYLQGILDQMGLHSAAIRKEEAADGVKLTLEGEGLGVVIGHRGETLDALQYLTGLAANRVDEKYFRVTLDCGNFREKREQTLEGLARKMATSAVKTGREIRLEPMNPYERRIIHAAVQKVAGATSASFGEEPNRRVVIKPTAPRKGGDSRNRRPGDRRSGGGGRRPGARGPRPLERTQDAARQAAPVQEAADKPLYSKIELDD